MSSTPKYDKPPVVETVLGVQFPELVGFKAAHFGLYWRQISRESFPTVEDRPRLSKVVEFFPRPAIFPGAQLAFSPGGAPDRTWYTGKSQEELIQVQPDRFLYNWRRRPQTGQYQFYDESSEKFLKRFEEFSTFCQAEKLGPPAPNLCEVTYTNHIRPEKTETAIQLFGKVFSGLRWETTDNGLPVPESAALNRTYVIAENRGRLYAEAAVAMDPSDPDRREFILLNMTARVNHSSMEPGSLAESLRLAHDWVVNGFASLTDREIQKLRWRRTA